MKRLFNWQILLGISLIVLSAAVYFIHYYIFRDAHHIFLYLIGDIAFVFIEVLLVTLVLHKLLNLREKKEMLHKLNMVIGAFFSEVGGELLELFLASDRKHSEIRCQLPIDQESFAKDFVKICNHAKHHQSDINPEVENLENIKHFLQEKRQFLLNLLENPNLLEHESFTNLLWAVFHLTEELAHRKSLTTLLKTDYQHLAGDIQRAYHLLMVEWLYYAKHLKTNYPYLFSLAIRTNPLDSNATIEVK